MKLNRGDIVIANLESVSKGSIQKYTRPYIIISNNKANQYSPVVTAVAMSTKTWKKKYLPTHCLIPAAKVKVTCRISKIITCSTFSAFLSSKWWICQNQIVIMH